MKKKGVSPIIATILLIALVVVIGGIIFVWIKGMTQESITKFDNKNIKIVCDEVSFEASYSNGFLSISNLGNVPIYSFDVKMEGFGSYTTSDIRDLSFEWGEAGLNQGGVFGDSISSAGSEVITLIPVLIGYADDGTKKTQACEERHGQEVYVA